MTTPPRLFISYRRADGEAFAHCLRDLLAERESGLTLRMDRTDMEGGAGWWKQIAAAIDAVEYAALALTPGALALGSVVRREWRDARQQGKGIYPIPGRRAGR